jgi:cytidylate kinase
VFNLLPKAIYTIAQSHGIILGRGAHLLLPGAFRVHLTASYSVRVKNLMQLYDLTERQAKKEIVATERDRREFLRALGKHLVSAPVPREAPAFDLEINMDRFSFIQATRLILAAAQEYFQVSLPMAKDL